MPRLPMPLSTVPRIDAARRPLAMAAALHLLVLVAGAGRAEDFQVNTYTTDNSGEAAVAMADDGQFIVLWRSYGIQARRFDADGNPLGEPFQLNTYTSGLHTGPRVAPRGDGFLVAWQRFEIGSEYVVALRQLDSAGNPIAGESQIVTNNAGFSANPALAVAPDDSFVVVWQSEPQYGDYSELAIRAQRFSSTGAALGGSFQVNSYTSGYQWYADVAADEEGNLVVVWQSGDNDGDDDIALRRIASSGGLLGSEILVNTYTTNSKETPVIARGVDGDFAVAWASPGSSGTDDSFRSIQLRRLGADASPIAAEMQVNAYTTSNQRNPAVAPSPHGGFVVSWDSFGSPENDDSSSSVLIAFVDPEGAPIGADFQVNTYTTNGQNRPDVAVAESGDIAVVWTSFGSSGGDPNNSIQLGFQDLGVFADGFESGDTSAWSLTTP